MSSFATFVSYREILSWSIILSLGDVFLCMCVFAFASHIHIDTQTNKHDIWVYVCLCVGVSVCLTGCMSLRFFKFTICKIPDINPGNTNLF